LPLYISVGSCDIGGRVGQWLSPVSVKNNSDLSSFTDLSLGFGFPESFDGLSVREDLGVRNLIRFSSFVTG